MISLEEALFPVTTTKPEQSQNITLYQKTITNIELIKPLLLQHYTQEQIAKELGCARETVSRIISKWMQTDDFKEWAHNLWLNQYNEFSNDNDLQVEAFKALTKLICAQTTRKAEIKTESTIQIDMRAQVAELIRISEDQCSKPAAETLPS